MNDLAPHAETLVKLIGVLFFICLGLVAFINALIWRNINTVIRKVDSFLKLHYECQKTLPEKYLCRQDFNAWIHDEWKPFLSQRGKDWEELWRAFNSHAHNGQSGKVIR